MKNKELRIRFDSAEEWREWLAANRGRAREAWLVWEKGRKDPGGLSYEEAVEEAICHGWIDSLVKRIDDKRYCRKFTPRTDAETWSPSNRKRLKKLIAEGRMTPAGMAVAGAAAFAEAGGSAPRDAEIRLPAPLQRLFQAEPAAWKNFYAFAPSYRRLALRWVLDAKRDGTRRRRLGELIRLSAGRRKLGLK